MTGDGVDPEPDEDAARGHLLPPPHRGAFAQALADPACRKGDADVDERVQRDADSAEHQHLNSDRAVLGLAELRQERQEEQRCLGLSASVSVPCRKASDLTGAVTVAVGIGASRPRMRNAWKPSRTR